MAMRQYFFVLEPKLLETARKCLVVFYGKILEKLTPGCVNTTYRFLNRTIESMCRRLKSF